MWVLPFLYSHHAYPISTFFQEWGAALLGCGAITVLISKRFWQCAEVPRIVLLPAVMLLLVLLQFAQGRIINLDQALLFALYFLWALMLVILGKHLRDEFGVPKITTILAFFLLVGAELNALSGIFQHYRWHTFPNALVPLQTSVAVYGNLAQPNHFASYITLGLISLGLLFTHKTIRLWHTVLLATTLLFVLTLSGSRSSWLYLLGLLLVAFLWQRHDKALLPLLRYYAIVLLGFGLMHLAIQIPWLANTDTSVTTVDRIFSSEVNSGSIRWALFHESWLIFSQFPVLGAGFGQFAWQHLQLDVAAHSPIIKELYNNAHNAVLQIAVEAGLVGLFVLLVTVGFWLKQTRNSVRSIYHFWGYAILLVLALHSLLEYPLWHTYFLGIATILLGLLDNTAYRLKIYNLGRIMIMAALIVGLLSLTQLFQSYRKLENTLAIRSLAAKDSRYVQPMHEALIELHGQLLLSSYAELFLSGMTEINTDHLADKLALNERAMRFMPIATVVYRQAWLLALADRHEEALAQLSRAMWAYPGNFASAQAELKELARENPAHFAALLEFATKKNTK